MCFLGYFLSPLFRFAKKGKLPFEPYTPTPANEIDHMLNNKWMEYLAGFRPDARIRDLVIPATHDVGTYALNNKTPFVFAARTQRVSIYQQLCAGSRSLDLRYGGDGKNPEEVYVYHGPYRSLKLEDAFIQISNFLAQNTKEFVLVALQEEQSVNDAQKQYMIGLVQKYLTPLAVTSSDTWFSPETATLGQMNHNRKNVFVVVDDDFFMLNQSKQGVDTFDYEAIGVFQSSLYYQSAWINTNKVPDLFQGDLAALAKWRQMPNTFYASQMILTLQTTKKDILAYAFGEESLRVDHQTKELQKNQQLPYFYVSNSQLPFNFVELDYIDYNPNLVKFLIGLNFPHKLSILQATLDEKDFTLEFNQQIRRAGALFIPDFKQSFKLPSVPKQLEITFLFEGDTQPVSRSFTLKDIDNQFVLTYLDISEPVKPKSTAVTEQDLDISSSRALTYN